MSSEMITAFSILWLLAAATSIPAMSIPAIADPSSTEATDPNSTDVLCSDCALQKQVTQETLPADALTMMRIELTKQRILQKLRLKAPPQHRMSALPSLITEGILLSQEKEEYVHLPGADDFYGTTQEVVIFPDNTTYTCHTTNAVHPTSCFWFELFGDIMISSVTSAELFIYKKEEEFGIANHTYVVSEVIPDSSEGGFRKRVVNFQEGAASSGWLRFEVGHAVARWTSPPHMSHALEVACITCEDSISELSVGTEEANRPFLVVHTDLVNYVTRKKRGIECSQTNNLCCREPFYLSFKDIGWNSWILHPSGYDAYYCRGSCLSEVSISRYHHTTVMQRYLQGPGAQAENMTLSLCCTPSVLTSIPLVYVDDQGYVFNKRLPNMVVEACDCA